MKAWQKGAILGVIWGLIPFIFGILNVWTYLYIDFFGYIGMVLLIPLFLASQIGFHYIFAFIGAPMVGAMIGSSAGFILGNWRNIKAWQKGAIIGLIWGLMSVCLYFSGGLEPDNNPETGEIEIFGGSLLLFVIWAVPFFLGPLILPFLLIYSFSKIYAKVRK